MHVCICYKPAQAQRVQKVYFSGAVTEGFNDSNDENDGASTAPAGELCAL